MQGVWNRVASGRNMIINAISRGTRYQDQNNAWTRSPAPAPGKR